MIYFSITLPDEFTQWGFHLCGSDDICWACSVRCWENCCLYVLARCGDIVALLFGHDEKPLRIP